MDITNHIDPVALSPLHELAERGSTMLRDVAGNEADFIDFPIRCRRLGAPVPFALEVSAHGRAEERRGEIPFGRFEPVVWEFEVR